MMEILAHDHDDLRALYKETAELVRSHAMPDAEAARQVVKSRLRFLKLMDSHLKAENAYVQKVLASSPAANDAALMHEFPAEMHDFLRRFSLHVAHWTPLRIPEHWTGYRETVTDMLVWLNGRLDREERDVFPVLRRHAGR